MKHSCEAVACGGVKVHPTEWTDILYLKKIVHLQLCPSSKVNPVSSLPF